MIPLNVLKTKIARFFSSFCNRLKNIYDIIQND